MLLEMAMDSFKARSRIAQRFIATTGPEPKLPHKQQAQVIHISVNCIQLIWLSVRLKRRGTCEKVAWT
jgi:hypothetical protein